MYKHVRTGKLYQFIGLARCVSKPDQTIVVYKQLYDSVLANNKLVLANNTSTKLPYGSLWTREKTDFEKKFVKYTEYFDLDKLF